MKIIDYILKFSFGIALGLVIIFKVSPLLFNKANELKNEVLIEDQLSSLIIESSVPNDYSYLKLKAEFLENKDFQQICYMSENNSCTRLINVLKTKKIIKSKLLKEVIPLRLDQKQIKSLGKIEIKINKENKNIEKLIISDVYIIGDKPSIVRIGFIYFLGGTLFILGVSSLIITIIMLFKNLRIYCKTDKLPELPNTVESKIKGVRFLIKWFRGN